MRIMVSGSRWIEDAPAVEFELRNYITPKDIVITGGCRGIDLIAYDFAQRMFAKNVVFKAYWDKHGGAAGPIRNAEMAKDADILIAFWDGVSRGTKSAIDEARKNYVETHIYYWKKS